MDDTAAPYRLSKIWYRVFRIWLDLSEACHSLTAFRCGSLNEIGRFSASVENESADSARLILTLSIVTSKSRNNSLSAIDVSAA